MTVTIECDAAGGRRARSPVRALVGGQLLHEDRVDLTSASSRTRFCRAVAEKLAVDAGLAGETEQRRYAAEAVGQIERLLLERLSALRTRDTDTQPAATDWLPIARPELFVTPEVIGMTMPAFVVLDDRPSGRWVLYLRWSCGRREARDLPSHVKLSSGSRLWLLPEPAPPPPDAPAGWSATARQAWLHGAPPPAPAQVYRRLHETLLAYLDFPAGDAQGACTTLSLWTLLTYFFQAWDAVPYLYLGGPAGSGKSRVLDLLSRSVARPVHSSSFTASALFRRLHDRGGTLLLDEAERLKESTPDASELRSILLAGYRRGGRATRNEPLGDGRFRQLEFDVYGPKAIACIAGLPHALASRCIPLVMFRAPPESDKPRLRLDEDPGLWQGLRDALYATAFESGGELLNWARRGDICPPMSGRNYELWQPLMSLGAWLEDCGVTGLHGVVWKHAERLIEMRQEELVPDTDEMLLRLLASALREGILPTPSGLLAKARELDTESFRNWKERSVSHVFGRYSIAARASHGVRAYRNVTLADLERIQRNYGMQLGIGEDPPSQP